MKKKRSKSSNPIASVRAEARRGLDLVPGAKKVGGLGPSTDRTDPRWIELGERIRRARQARGWSQSNLARRAKWSQSDLSDLERGQVGPQGPSLRTLMNIADALEIDLPISSERPDECMAQAEIAGDVTRAVTDYCTANALFTSDEWGHFRAYVDEHIDSLDLNIGSSSHCVVWTLGTDGEVKNLRTMTPSVVAVVRGGGNFQFYFDGSRHKRTIREGKIAGFLDIDSCLGVRASGGTGLTLMTVPIFGLMASSQDDELAC